MADRIIKPDSGNDVVIQNNGGTRKIEVTNSGDVEVTGDFKATTVKATNLKANDGTAALVISDSSGNVSFNEKNISNVGDISLDTISSDSGTSIGVTLGTDAGDDFNVGSGKFVVEGDTGNVGIGTSSPSENLTIASTSPQIRLEDTDASGTPYCKVSGSLGNIYIQADEGNEIADSKIDFRVDGLQRMIIDSSGNLLVGKTSLDNAIAGFQVESNGGASFVRDSNPAFLIGRNTNDGTLMNFRQDNVTEGSISVSGSTVSYNGGHLSRWSQLADNTRNESILKGTVMSNLDQMAEWTTDGVTEENEQLNCTKVSDVEGDPNVAGVFVNWDNDDDIYTNDMNMAMTGDMVIRIAQGVAVEKGQLLMSAGDGTAKPQGDDIVRNKTVAKVTSNHVSHTYDDGSFCVPCILMAC